MAQDSLIELQKMHRAVQDKFDYFLMTMAVAAIGFAITQTRQATLEWPMLPLGGAVVCWAASVWAGCRRQAFVDCTIYGNMMMLQVERGLRPEIMQGVLSTDQACSAIQNAVEDNSRCGATWAKWQFYLFATGVVLFITWQVLEMGVRQN